MLLTEGLCLSVWVTQTRFKPPAPRSSTSRCTLRLKVRSKFPRIRALRRVKVLPCSEYSLRWSPGVVRPVPVCCPVDSGGGTHCSDFDGRPGLSVGLAGGGLGGDDEAIRLFRHSLEPQILDSVPVSHPLHGRDLRTLGDAPLVEAAARAILPSFDRLWSHLCHSDEQHPELRDLTSSVLRRIVRILIQRIRIEELSEGGDPSLEVQDALLEAVTLAFVHMVGVFDALAIVNGLLAGQTRYQEMGWQKKEFRKAMRQAAPDAMSLIEPNTEGGKYLEAVLHFRNTIHRRMPDPATSGRADDDPSLRGAVLLLERRSHGEIVDAFKAVGWTTFAGVKLVGDSLLFLRPTTVVGLLLNGGIPLVNRLMDATPAERLGTRRFDMDPDRTLFPSQLKQYAVEYFGISHLTKTC